MTTPQPWVYTQAQVTNVVDGDTFDANIDLGFHITVVERFRLKGCNTPELHGSDPRERTLAKQAFDKLHTLIAYRRVEIRSWKADSFGRWLADVWVKGPDGAISVSIAETLINGGWAVAWDGRGTNPRPWLDPNYTYPHPST